jgi:ABC-type glycerol-3-phosphate transport system permease component
MLLTSLKTQSEAIRVPPVIFPAKPVLSNYTDVFRDVPFGRMYLNTIISAVVTVAAQLLLCSMAAYAFAKLEFPGRDIIFMTLLAVLMVPSSFFTTSSTMITASQYSGTGSPVSRTRNWSGFRVMGVVSVAPKVSFALTPTPSIALAA